MTKKKRAGLSLAQITENVKGITGDLNEALADYQYIFYREGATFPPLSDEVAYMRAVEGLFRQLTPMVRVLGHHLAHFDESGAEKAGTDESERYIRSELHISYATEFMRTALKGLGEAVWDMSVIERQHERAAEDAVKESE